MNNKLLHIMNWHHCIVSFSRRDFGSNKGILWTRRITHKTAELYLKAKIKSWKNNHRGYHVNRSWLDNSDGSDIIRSNPFASDLAVSPDSWADNHSSFHVRPSSNLQLHYYQKEPHWKGRRTENHE